MRNISNIKGVLYAVVSSATFGLIPLFSIPLLHAGMASPTILFYRMLLSAAIMAAVALLLKRNFRISRRDFGVLAGLSLMYAPPRRWDCCARTITYRAAWPPPSIFSIRWW